jgi:hypothetical protein
MRISWRVAPTKTFREPQLANIGSGIAKVLEPAREYGIQNIYFIWTVDHVEHFLPGYYYFIWWCNEQSDFSQMNAIWGTESITKPILPPRWTAVDYFAVQTMSRPQ